MCVAHDPCTCVSFLLIHVLVCNNCDNLVCRKSLPIIIIILFGLKKYGGVDMEKKFDIAEREGTHWLFFSTLGILLGDI